MTIAVTGPFASGKSTLVRLLADLGAETVSSDELVHDLLAVDEETVSRVIERFGEDVWGERGVDRKVLGQKVFGDPAALQDLEGILHPSVRRETDRRARESGAEVFVAEIPLLFEGGGGERFDLTVAVVTPDECRRAWASERGVDEERFRVIEGRQLPQEEKARQADLVVVNDADLDKLREEARRIWELARDERSRDGSADQEG